MSAEKRETYIDSWRCDYRATDEVLKYARFDYGCPRCGTPFAEFVPNLKDIKDKEGANEANGSTR